ncbi:hypothetical protein P0R31_06775 [Bradyrhizobium yuanmingense]|uniref:hypothetical protein n=1 Tax=Bradyrhizobium yuanmingense TaxID=108015 RepID=UPI0023B9F538|nr:hypothetical protein [Bradyrhizobium yuanmingense]MDF0516929.1 hypothetical protein [Bradyrhizobium yuanmingense]
MSSGGLAALLLQLLGIHSATTQHELMGLFEIARGLCTSYRFASSGPGAGALYGRITLYVYRLIAAAIARHAVMPAASATSC